VAGLILRAVFAVMLLVRRPRPIHVRGVVYEGVVTWMPEVRRSGVAWIDQPVGHEERVTARASRSLGLPPALPDVIGLSLRAQTENGPADLELASTGVGVPGRFLLSPRRSPVRATLGTLLPYRGARGAVLICARTPASLESSAQGRPGPAPSPWTLRLYWAAPRGSWFPFAEVTLERALQSDDPTLRFDAVRRPLPGAGTYTWTRLLREPSYRLVQRMPA
jgi:hypothetical protein